MSGPRISKGGSGLPSRVVCHGVEGIGKSTFGAYAPAPIFLMTRGETGLLTLIDSGRVPETDHFDECEKWWDVKAAINYLIKNPTGHRTLVLDTLNGAERLCVEHVCDNDFEGNWKSYGSFGRGVQLAEAEWHVFLTMLDQLRDVRRMGIICLCHTKIKSFRNPLGDDFDRYQADMQERMWGLAAKWSDIILFGNFDVSVKKEQKADRKGKAVGDVERTLYTVRSPAFDAKNRLGLPAEIPMGSRPEDGWRNFAAALKKVRSDALAAQRAAAEELAAAQVPGAAAEESPCRPEEVLEGVNGNGHN